MVRPSRPTPRQVKVLWLIAGGQSNKEIAHALAISEAGVKKHIEALMRRYGATRRTGLVRRALETGDLTLHEHDLP